MVAPLRCSQIPLYLSLTHGRADRSWVRKFSASDRQSATVVWQRPASPGPDLNVGFRCISARTGPAGPHPSRPFATVAANSIWVKGLAEFACQLTPPVNTTGTIVSSR